MAGETRNRLTPKAIADLEAIWLYTTAQWSAEQADQYVDELEQVFNTLAAMPGIARERREFSPPVRIHPHRQHLIIYREASDAIEIIRILGGSQDWMAVFKRLD